MNPPAEPVAKAVPKSGPLDTGLLRDRMRLYLKVMFFITLAALLVNRTVHALDMAPELQPSGAGYLVVLWIILALLAAGWMYMARGEPSRSVVLGVDILGTLAISWLFTQLASSAPEDGELLALFLTALVLVLRASVVPSSVSRTLLVGALSVGAVVVAAAFWASATPGVKVLWVGPMGAWFVSVTAVTSHVIYGLRREVKAAKRLGQYELNRKIGEGGMGVVYEATHVLLRRPTALKLLPIDEVGEKNVARFEREARQTSRLEHPNSVFIYDYGRTPDGRFYYAMELLDGLTLDELVREHGPQPQARVAAILIQACRALAEAHAMALVHRDIKPANIMLCNRGLIPDMVKVLDFGLVKTADDSDSHLTLDDAVMGTPLYLAPEGIKSPAEVGPASDVYALGAVAYFLLTGEHVFSGATVIEVCGKHLSDPPTPPSAVTDNFIDPAFESIVLRCLAKSPQDRFSDGAELATALGQIHLGGWGVEDAAGWWKEHDTGSTRPSPLDPAPAGQVTVDISAQR